MNLRIGFNIELMQSRVVPSGLFYIFSYYVSIKYRFQLSSLNIVNVPVVLMRALLVCIHKTLSNNSLLQDYQVGLRYNITGFIRGR